MRLSFFDIRNHGYFFWTLITVMSNYFFLLSRLTTAWPWPTDQWSSRSSASSRRAYRTYREGGTVLCTIKNPVKMAWGTIFFVWHPFPFPPPPLQEAEQAGYPPEKLYKLAERRGQCLLGLGRGEEGRAALTQGPTK